MEKDEKKPRQHTMIKRTITGIVLTGIMFLIFWLTGLNKPYTQIIFDVFVMAFMVIASFEMCKVMQAGGLKPSKIALLIPLISVYPLCYHFDFLGLLATIAISVIAAFIDFIFNSKRSFNDFLSNILLIIYPISMLSLCFTLSKVYGLIPVLLAAGASLMSDAFAYFFGSLIKGKKIFPKISPKKTYAGCIAGLFGGIAGGLFIYAVFEVGLFPANIIFTFSGNSDMPILLYAVIGLLISVFSEIGDLAASRIKRQFNIKDYGTILGSHGGVMDRIDSILFGLVVVSLIMFFFFS